MRYIYICICTKRGKVHGNDFNDYMYIHIYVFIHMYINMHIICIYICILYLHSIGDCSVNETIELFSVLITAEKTKTKKINE